MVGSTAVGLNRLRAAADVTRTGAFTTVAMHGESREPDMTHAASLSRGELSFSNDDIEKMVDRLAAGLRAQSTLVRELDAAHAQLAARQTELEASRAKAELAAETLSTFLHALGHDLRAPLVAIDANLQLVDVLRTGLAPDEITACMADMRRTCDHGLALIRDLFELIRSDAGQWRVLRTPVSLADVIKDACAVAATQAQANGLHIETQWNIDAGEIIDTDGTRLRQALANLLLNATKYGDRGVIQITAGRTHAGELELSVSDEGRGIDPALLPTIFDPFTRCSTRNDHTEVGVGLGLAIVRRCARLLGGDVSVQNRVPRGASFTIRIPAPVCGCVVAPHIAAPVSAPIPHRSTPLQGVRVLIIDDAPDAARLLGHHLRLLGAESAVAESLAHARLRLTTQRFDLVISDLNLLGGSGLDVRSDTDLPVCISSSTPFEELPASARANFLAKPISLATVRETVLTLLARVST